MTDLPAILGGKPVFEKYIPIVRAFLPDFADMSEQFEQMLNTGIVTKGRYLEELEHAIENHLGVNNAIAVSSCTSGLMLTYKTLGLSGDVIVPSFTFMATVSALTWCGLTPLFADVDHDTTNLDPASVEEVITPQTSAIVGVHNFGNPAQIQKLQDIANKHGIKLIFDAAHGFGSLYAGNPLGAQGNAQVFSMSPTKLLISGEGGLVATNDKRLAYNILIGREYGNDGNYDSAFPGMNARMPETNALIGLYSLKKLEKAAQNRNRIAEIYHQRLGSLPGLGFQKVLPGNRNSYKDFSITIDSSKFGLRRDNLAMALFAENIDNRKYYDPPVHQQHAYRQYYNGHPLPNTDWLSRNSLSLPIWSVMDDEIPQGICDAITRIYNNIEAVNAKLASQ